MRTCVVLSDIFTNYTAALISLSGVFQVFLFWLRCDQAQLFRGIKTEQPEDIRVIVRDLQNKFVVNALVVMNAEFGKIDTFAASICGYSPLRT